MEGEESGIGRRVESVGCRRLAEGRALPEDERSSHCLTIRLSGVWCDTLRIGIIFCIWLSYSVKRKRSSNAWTNVSRT